MTPIKPKTPPTPEQQAEYDALVLRLTPEPRKKTVRKAVTNPSRHNLRERYYAARRVMFEREYPAAWAVGGYYDNPLPTLHTTNGTQNYIQDVLNNLGHQCERVNTMGIPMVDKKTKEVTWRRSGSTTGSTDLHAMLKLSTHQFPIPWKIEVKKDYDTMRDAQLKYEAKVKSVGALHTILYVGNLDLFWDAYDQYIQL